MLRFSTSMILLIVVTVTIYLGLAQRVIDRMRLSHKTALTMLLLLIGAHFLPAVVLFEHLSLRLGAFIPLGICGYLLLTCSKKEQVRALAITATTTTLLLLSDYLLPIEPGTIPYDLDPLYMSGILAGLLAYSFTRSRRSAFIGAVGAVFFSDLFAVLFVTYKGYNSSIILGSGGAFDALMINGIIAVAIAEVIGEVRERIHRGPAKTAIIKDSEKDE